MNDLLSKAFPSGSIRTSYRSHTQDSLLSPLHNPENIEVGVSIHNDDNLVWFLQQVDRIDLEMEDINELLQKLQDGRENYWSVRHEQAMKALRKEIDGNVEEVLKKARSIKGKLDDLDQANQTNNLLPGCEEGSPVYRIRIFVTNGLRGKLKDLMVEFDALRQKMREEYRGMLERSYYAVTGQHPDDALTEQLIDTGINEDFLRLSIEQQGKGHVLDTIHEIQERSDALKEIEQNLLQLRQVFLDMAVLVETQGEGLNDIEKAMLESVSFTKAGAEQLNAATKRKASSRKWVWIVTVSVLILATAVTVLVLFLLFNRSNK